MGCVAGSIVGLFRLLCLFVACLLYFVLCWLAVGWLFGCLYYWICLVWWLVGLEFGGWGCSFSGLFGVW